MPTELLIAIIIVGVLAVAFLVTSVLRTNASVKAENEKFDVENASKAEETSAEEPAPAEEIKAEETPEQPAEEPVEEVKAEEPAEEIAEQPAEEPAFSEEVKAEETPEQPAEEVASAAVVIGDVDEKTRLQIKRVPFSEKLLAQPENVLEYFNAIHNEFISYRKLHARISKKCASYRFGRVLVAKLFIKGKTMKLALKLNVSEFNEKVYFQKDMSKVNAYAEVPFTVKIKSGRAAKRAVALVNALAEKQGIVKKSKFTPVDAIAEIKAVAEAEKNK